MKQPRRGTGWNAGLKKRKEARGMERLPAELAGKLVAWYRAGHRDLPWRQDKEPYHVWLSEIMLQQTRVEAVKGYYARFLRELPTIEALAACEPDRLQKLWEGLGYYSRVRNLQKAARIIVNDLGGEFPRTLDEIRILPGVGAYTAGAIASICFELPAPAVDGNVLRVLSRVMADDSSVSKQAVKDRYSAKLAEVYPAGACGDFTQSLMELGATVCLPNGEPRCETCPIASVCRARADGAQKRYPVKEAKKNRRMENLTAFRLLCGEKCAVRKRADAGLLAGLWELPNVPGLLDASGALALLETWDLQPRELVSMREKTHIFTHVAWNMRCFTVVCAREAAGFTWVDGARFDHDIALPTAFRQFWE